MVVGVGRWNLGGGLIKNHQLFSMDRHSNNQAASEMSKPCLLNEFLRLNPGVAPQKVVQ